MSTTAGRGAGRPVRSEEGAGLRFLIADADVGAVVDVLREVRLVLDRYAFGLTESLPADGGWLDVLLDPVTAIRAVGGRANTLQPSAVAGAYRAALATRHPEAVRLHELFSGRPVRRSRADALLTSALVDRLLRVAALTEVGELVRSEILLVPHRGDLFVADGLQHQGETDFSYLGRLTFPGPDLLSRQSRAERPGRRPLRRALDLGCGAGVGAVIASRSADEVIGTDLLPRCVRFGEVNAALNDVGNVSFQVADVLDGIDGDFDAILTHPPGVWSLTAGGAVAEVGGGDYGLELPARMIRGALDRLRPGGTAYAIVMAPVIAGVPYAPVALERICEGRPAEVTLYPLLEYYEFGDRRLYRDHRIDRLVRHLAVLRPAAHFSVSYAALDRSRWWSSKLRAAPARVAARLVR